MRIRKKFYRLEDWELKDREVKVKRGIDELFYKPIMVSIDDKDNFEKNQMSRIRPTKNIWYDCLINYIPEL